MPTSGKKGQAGSCLLTQCLAHQLHDKIMSAGTVWSCERELRIGACRVPVHLQCRTRLLQQYEARRVQIETRSSARPSNDVPALRRRAVLRAQTSLASMCRASPGNSCSCSPSLYELDPHTCCTSQGSD
ncbi:unnamed protein product [Polarella glacialis]|uniref:Uncharacterized protein n=1 Tax=Polarella glacialis TaxID=89957 RepID=A0A813ICV9_POLGL|nr:unnamed protein product [Polarella glacialis]